MTNGRKNHSFLSTSGLCCGRAGPCAALRAQPAGAAVVVAGSDRGAGLRASASRVVGAGQRVAPAVCSRLNCSIPRSSIWPTTCTRISIHRSALSKIAPQQPCCARPLAPWVWRRRSWWRRRGIGARVQTSWLIYIKRSSRSMRSGIRWRAAPNFAVMALRPSRPRACWPSPPHVFNRWF